MCASGSVCSVTISTAVAEQSEKEGRQGEALRGEGERGSLREEMEKRVVPNQGKKLEGRASKKKKVKIWC